jgi:hypothetical protein
MFLDQIPAVRLSQTNVAQWVKLPTRMSEFRFKNFDSFLARTLHSTGNTAQILELCDCTAGTSHSPGALSLVGQMEALDAAAVKRGIRG